MMEALSRRSYFYLNGDITMNQKFTENEQRIFKPSSKTN